ncbi:hypothetical protein G7046_g9201 [Stylonectria norvegica]|nr:hypothetical protein G7046_g9201 [Stylonectria norvegica]
MHAGCDDVVKVEHDDFKLRVQCSRWSFTTGSLRSLRRPPTRHSYRGYDALDVRCRSGSADARLPREANNATQMAEHYTMYSPGKQCAVCANVLLAVQREVGLGGNRTSIGAHPALGPPTTTRPPSASGPGLRWLHPTSAEKTRSPASLSTVSPPPPQQPTPNQHNSPESHSLDDKPSPENTPNCLAILGCVVEHVDVHPSQSRPSPPSPRRSRPQPPKPKTRNQNPSPTTVIDDERNLAARSLAMAANYNGRRAPNVSQYLRDLNAINPQDRPATEENFNMEEDLALFTNTQFFDFETGQNTDYQAHPAKLDTEAPPSATPTEDLTPAGSVMGDLGNLDFIQESFAFIQPPSHPRLVDDAPSSALVVDLDTKDPKRRSKEREGILPRVTLPLVRCAVIIGSELSQAAPKRTSIQMWPAPATLTTLNGWMTNGRDGAISRDLPPGDHDIAQGPSRPLRRHGRRPKPCRPLPQPFIQSLCFNVCDFSFPDFTNGYPSTPLNGFADGAHAQNFQGIGPNPAGVYPPVSQQQQAQQQAQYGQSAVRSAEKRKSIDMDGSVDSIGHGRAMNFEDASRHAAEEDKRRRNTAASARFRIKKKQREQALEKSAKEMTDKVNGLESKVQQLEMENKWLKNLLVEKNEGNDEIVTLWKEFASKQTVTLKSKTESKKESSSVKDELKQR